MDTARTSRRTRGTKQNDNGSATRDPRVVALVKLLARQAAEAEAEYERLLRTRMSAQPPPPEESAS